MASPDFVWISVKVQSYYKEGSTILGLWYRLAVLVSKNVSQITGRTQNTNVCKIMKEM